MTESRPNLLLLGDADLDGTRAAVVCLQDGVRGSTIRIAKDIAALRQFVDFEQWFPDLIVVSQAWPDQFSEAEVHALMGLCPLARLICCFGPWCDSDGRTRSIWPLAVRVPVETAARRLKRELALVARRDVPLRSLPLTASRAEIFEFDCGQSEPDEPEARTVAVFSPDRRWKEMIESGIRKSGLGNHAPHSGERPKLVLFDADPWDAERAVSLQALRATNREARLVAAVGFPRPDLETALRKSGADQVWFKLAPLADLFVVPPAGDIGGMPPSGRTPSGSTTITG